jgi:DNA-binding beta-propeller fold protein YncE
LRKLYAVVTIVGAVVAAVLDIAGTQAQVIDPNSAPDPYHVVNNWAKLPEGRRWGMAIGVDVDRDGTSVWVFDRCGGKTCDGSNIAPIQKFDAAGRLVVSFGSGLFSWPHGLFAAPDGTLWVTDGKKQTVMHFAPDGRLLMTLGKPGVAGDGPDTFNSPSDVLVAPNGDIFVAAATVTSRYRTRMIASSSFRRTGNSSRLGATADLNRATSTCPMGWPWIPRAASSSPTARTTVSRSSIRTASC